MACRYNGRKGEEMHAKGRLELVRISFSFSSGPREGLCGRGLDRERER